MTAVALPFTGEANRTCAYCGREEPNDFLRDNNHSDRFTGARMSGECMAMSLTRNHVFYDVDQVEQARWQLENAGHKQLVKRRGDLTHAQVTLRRSLARVRQVWPDLAELNTNLAEHGITSARVAEALA